MTVDHPYIKYAQALVMLANKLPDCASIRKEHIIAEIEKGLHSFRVQPREVFEGTERVKYEFSNAEKGNPDEGVFLSPNVLSSDKSAQDLISGAQKLIEELKNRPLEKEGELSTSIAPVTGEYLGFSLQGGVGRGKPKAALMARGLCAITTLTRSKPCFQYKKGKSESFNVALIPNLPVEKMKVFIQLFERMRDTQASELMTGRVWKDEKKGTYKPLRPSIFRGNFPNPPLSSAFGNVAVLGAIGEMTKEAECSDEAKEVLTSLKNTEIYLMKYGGGAVFTYNNHVIDLAARGKLSSIVKDLYRSRLYNQDIRSKKQDNAIEYQKFDLFASRFLQLFDSSSFRDFLAIRAEYHGSLSVLFKNYFCKMERLEKEVVLSAMFLGRWMNQVAYYAAKAEVGDWEEGEERLAYNKKIRDLKSKFLVELESSVFSSKSGDELIARAVIRAGRLSGMDAPADAALFMKEAAIESLSLDQAKNLLVAFSRLMHKSGEVEVPDESVDNEAESSHEDNSNVL
jgi:CRISPR-associated protein Cas8c/Csp2